MHLSDNLYNILKQFDNKILSKILESEIDIDYLDTSKKDPYKISFIHKSKIKNTDDIWSKNRNILKPGKLLKRILPNTPNEKIEYFSNFYKSVIDNNKNEYTFKIINGDFIKKYYHYSSYSKLEGSLGHSCMKYDQSQKLIDFYSYNDLKMLVLLKNEKLLGRSLLWETDQNIKIMDRIYSINDKINSLFNQWAIDNKYYRKKTNKWNDTINFISPNNESIQLKLSVKLKLDTKFYPYLDTFKWFDPYKKILYNYKYKKLNQSLFISNFGNSTILFDTRVLIRTDGKFYPNTTLSFDEINNVYEYSSKIIKCNYLNKYTNIDNTIYSNIYNDHILKKDVNFFDKYIIFKDDKYNDVKKILKFILNSTKEQYYNNSLTSIEFKRSKKLFEFFEKKLKK